MYLSYFHVALFFVFFPLDLVFDDGILVAVRDKNPLGCMAMNTEAIFLLKVLFVLKFSDECDDTGVALYCLVVDLLYFLVRLCYVGVTDLNEK